jgi:ankyrin repeat protein
VHVVLADPVPSQEKVTPLYWAAMGGHAEVVKALLAAGANVHATDEVIVELVEGGEGGWITETRSLN